MSIDTIVNALLINQGTQPFTYAYTQVVHMTHTFTRSRNSIFIETMPYICVYVFNMLVCVCVAGCLLAGSMEAVLLKVEGDVKAMLKHVEDNAATGGTSSEL